METVTEIRDNGQKRSRAQDVPRLCAHQDAHDRRELVCGAQHPRRDELCGAWFEARPSDRRRSGSPWAWKRREIKLSYEVGDSVKIIDGPLEGFVGVVKEISMPSSSCVTRYRSRCWDARHRWSSSSTRWRSRGIIAPKALRRVFRIPGLPRAAPGVGGCPVASQFYHIFSKEVLRKWHRK